MVRGRSGTWYWTWHPILWRPDHAHSFAYVIDCSGSMATRDSLEVAKREMVASISQLPPDGLFAVILYNLQARMLSRSSGTAWLMAATAANKQRVRSQLTTIQPDGGTRPHAGLTNRTDFKTRGDLFPHRCRSDVQWRCQPNLNRSGQNSNSGGRFGRGTELGQRTPIGTAGDTTGGSYLYVDVSRFPRSPAGF